MIKRNLKKYLGTTLAALTVFSTVMPTSVYASDNLHVNSSFEVEDICTYSVSLPDSLPLSYDKESKSYIASDSIRINGELSDSYYVEVSADSLITYTNQLDENMVFGTLSFEDCETTNAIWTNEDIINQKEQKFSITVDASQTLTKGNYISDLNFRVEVKSIEDIADTCTEHNYVFTDNGNGTHKITCTNCDLVNDELCEYDEVGICTKCGAVLEENTDTDTNENTDTATNENNDTDTNTDNTENNDTDTNTENPNNDNVEPIVNNTDANIDIQDNSNVDTNTTSSNDNALTE